MDREGLVELPGLSAYKRTISKSKGPEAKRHRTLKEPILISDDVTPVLTEVSPNLPTYRPASPVRPRPSSLTTLLAAVRRISGLASACVDELAAFLKQSNGDEEDLTGLFEECQKAVVVTEKLIKVLDMQGIASIEQLELSLGNEGQPVVEAMQSSMHDLKEVLLRTNAYKAQSEDIKKETVERSGVNSLVLLRMQIRAQSAVISGLEGHVVLAVISKKDQKMLEELQRVQSATQIPTTAVQKPVETTYSENDWSLEHLGMLHANDPAWIRYARAQIDSGTSLGVHRAALIEAWLDPDLKKRMLYPVKAWLAYFDATSEAHVCWSWALYTDTMHNVQGKFRKRANYTLPLSPWEKQGLVYNWKLPRSSLGLETGREKTYNMPSRPLLLKAIMEDWGLGRLCYEQDKSRQGYTYSHLCGMNDCIRPSHGCFEFQGDNNTRQACHKRCKAGMSESAIQKAMDKCEHAVPCNIRARALTVAYGTYVAQMAQTLSQRAQRVLAL